MKITTLTKNSPIKTLELPPVVPITGPLQYGSYQLLARYCKLSAIPKAGEMTWQHGWHPPEHNVHPELVVGTNGYAQSLAEKRLHLVARQDQKDYLKNKGFKRVEAVGLPIVYVDQPKIKRLKHSLLVMPIHTLADVHFTGKVDVYVENIMDIKKNFDVVAACISPHCIKNGYWVKEFQKRDIPIIEGADPGDRNGLLRMAMLLSQFEYVTTNGFGSQIVYGSYFGAKVSVFGNYADRTVNEFKEAEIYRNCPELLPKVVNFSSKEFLETLCKPIFCHPAEAPGMQEWAAFQLGADSKQNPSMLRKILANNGVNSAKGGPMVSVTKPVSTLYNRTERRVQKNMESYTLWKQKQMAIRCARTNRELRITWNGIKLNTSRPMVLYRNVDRYLVSERLNFFVNPLEGPIVDLCPDEGSVLIGWRHFHPQRTCCFVENEPRLQSFLKKNSMGLNTAIEIKIENRTKARNDECSNHGCSLICDESVEEISQRFGGTEVVRVIKVRVCEYCAADTIAWVGKFEGVRRLIIEFYGDIAKYYFETGKQLEKFGYELVPFEMVFDGPRTRCCERVTSGNIVVSFINVRYSNSYNK